MDTLTKWFNAKVKEDATLFQAFQLGASTAAASMRERAMKQVTGNDLNVMNRIKNAIGQLSDIPTE